MTDGADRDEQGRFVAGYAGGPGRTSVYNDELGEDICSKLMEGMTLNAICKLPGMPDGRAVRMWAGNPEHPFSPKYTRAREIGYQKMADDLLDISDDGTNDYVEREGREFENGEAIARSRLRVDTRKWLLSKALPKLYGEKIVQEQTGSVRIEWGKAE